MVTHRHLLYNEQKAEIVKGLNLRLRQLLEEREDLEAATYVFYALHRLTDPKQGRPRYPEVTWGLIEDYLRDRSASCGS